MDDRDDLFYARWILANAAAEGAGLGTTLLLAHFVGGALAARPGAGAALLVALLAIALGTGLEGALVGWAQGRVIASRTPRIRVRAWALATALGAAIAWTLGLLPSTAAALLEHTPAAPPGPPLPGPLLALLGSGLGLLLGAVLALPQWRVLRRRAVPRAWTWLPANAAAWAIGMVAVWIGMDLVPWQAGAAAIVASVYLVCTAAGTLVGAVHGAILVRLLAEAEPANDGAANGAGSPAARPGWAPGRRSEPGGRPPAQRT